MRRSFVFALVLGFCLVASASFGQHLGSKAAGKTRHPLSVGQLQSFMAGPARPTHLALNKLSASTNNAIKSGDPAKMAKIRSIPNFTSAFTFQGQTFPFTMAGHAPQHGGTTRLDTSYLAISFVFDEFVDQNGNNIVIDATGNTNNLLRGPDFEDFPYTTGNTQFSDAVQRAEFLNVMNDHGNNGPWHTLLERPRQFIPVTVEVPFFESLVFQDPEGTLFAVIDFDFMFSQLNTLAQTENMQVSEIPIFVTHNAVYADFFAGGFSGCCIGGFHTAFETQQTNTAVFVQVFDFAASLDADVASFIFGDPTIFADVFAVSHEATETINDPFVDNIVPRWEFPGLPFIECSSFLETGDPVTALPNPSFPVMIDGFLYHPQTEALLQWFSRATPSTAFDGAYSYPGNNLTSPSKACPAGF